MVAFTLKAESVDKGVRDAGRTAEVKALKKGSGKLDG